jgi:crotonobetainyl-CoA:carnitine CoA-transferase CaiB-like acyl-CoA transferase
VDDPQIAAREMLVEIDHPQEGIVKVPGCPIKFSDTKIERFDPSPLLGENTVEILKKFGGYSEAEIKKMKEDSIIFQ